MVITVMTITAVVIVAAILATRWYASRREYLQWLKHARAKQRWNEMNSNNSKEEC